MRNLLREKIIGGSVTSSVDMNNCKKSVDEIHILKKKRIRVNWSAD